MSETLTQSERDKKNGQFVTGSKGGPGRKLGSRNKLGEQFVSDLRDCWNEHGAEALARCATEDPSAFVKVVAGLLPRALDVNIAVDAAEFGDKFRSALVMLGNEPEAAPPRRSLRQVKVIDHEH